MLLSLSVIVIVILSSFFPVSKWVELRRGKEGEKKTKNANQCAGINVYYRIDPAVSRSEIKGFSKRKTKREKRERRERRDDAIAADRSGRRRRERERERGRRRRRRRERRDSSTAK